MTGIFYILVILVELREPYESSSITLHDYNYLIIHSMYCKLYGGMPLIKLIKITVLPKPLLLNRELTLLFSY